VYGTIVSARPVVLKDAKQLQDNVLGGAAGGVVGGIAGSGMGGGSGQGLATAGGAIAGALLGAYIQDELGTQQGYEYIVKLDSPRYQGDIGSSKKSVTIKGQNSVSQDIKDSIHTTETESSAISVAQADDVMLQAGTRVMVVYNDDRPRVVPAN
jgi:outer membrane lipoprotein SlyB